MRVVVEWLLEEAKMMYWLAWILADRLDGLPLELMSLRDLMTIENDNMIP